METIDHLSHCISKKGFKPNINLDRPNYIQPEDRLQYRSARLIVILGMLNTNNGLSKDVIACVDFLLRNEAFQIKFILEYFNGQKNIINKIQEIEKSNKIEMDFNVVQYKSVPWDIRFNDMLLYLYIRNLIKYKTDRNNKNIRILISPKGQDMFNGFSNIFPSEVNFLELFGKKMSEEKTIKIITEVIPNSYWKQNAQLKNK